jgi:hypothetical protein
MKKLTRDQWHELYYQNERTKEAEVDFSRPAGEHYNLKALLDRFGIVYRGDKKGNNILDAQRKEIR